VYAQAARVVAVTETPAGLCALAWERDTCGAQCGSRTQAALVHAGGVLFAQPASALLPYVEPIGGERGAAWLWNGSTVLRRVD
jgi:hypothetical protein